MAVDRLVHAVGSWVDPPKHPRRGSPEPELGLRTPKISFTEPTPGPSSTQSQLRGTETGSSSTQNQLRGAALEGRSPPKSAPATVQRRDVGWRPNISTRARTDNDAGAVSTYAAHDAGPSHRRRAAARGTVRGEGDAGHRDGPSGTTELAEQRCGPTWRPLVLPLVRALHEYDRSSLRTIVPLRALRWSCDHLMEAHSFMHRTPPSTFYR